MSAAEFSEAEIKELISHPRAQGFDGVLAVGGKLSVELLVHAYEHGVFPWPHEGYPMLWFCPDERGVIDFSEVHEPKSFKKWRRHHESEFEVKFDVDFSQVIRGCQKQKRKGQRGTWITDEIIENYSKLFQLNRAFCVSVYREGKLVAGLYGVRNSKYLGCESMFHTEDNTSKLALIRLIESEKSKGNTWIDIQMVTDVCESFGGKYISKIQFLKRIGQ